MSFSSGGDAEKLRPGDVASQSIFVERRFPSANFTDR